MFILLNHVLFARKHVMCHLDAIAEHDVLVLAVVGLLLPDIDLLLQHPVHLVPLPVPVVSPMRILTLGFHLRTYWKPGTKNRT